MRSTALAYLSPEQAVGCVPVAGRSDVYSLGVLTYELLAGVRPFAVSTLADLLTQHQLDGSLLLPAQELGLPPGTELIVAKAMAKSPFDRFASAGDFVHALSLMAKPVARRSESPRRVSFGSLCHRQARKPLDTARSWRYARRLDPRRKMWRRAAATLFALGCVLVITLARWPWMVDIGARLHLEATAFACLVRTLSAGLSADPLPLGR
jgi:serine/threonine protein kinase